MINYYWPLHKKWA